MQLEDYYEPKYNDKDYVNTEKYNDWSLEELKKEIEIEKKKSEKYMFDKMNLNKNQLHNNFNNIKYEYFNKKVKVTTIYGTEITGIFIDDFAEEKEIAINCVRIKYYEVKSMELAENNKKY